MTSPNQTKPTPIPAIIVYGTPTSPELTQASWFRAEDMLAAKAAAGALKFSVIELKTDADRALTAGVHEGVLKGNGRMVVGSVTAEVYKRIEEYAAKWSGAPRQRRRMMWRAGQNCCQNRPRTMVAKTRLRHRPQRLLRRCPIARPR